jgi:hypothetical protein
VVVNLSKFALIPLLAAAAAGCSGARGGVSPEPDTRVAIEVQNLSGSPIEVQVCTDPQCLPLRRLEGRRQTVFMFQPQGNSAYVVARTVQPLRSAGVIQPLQAARPGWNTQSRILEGQLVEFEPGDRKAVVFNIL